jgi:ClpP class serine protease
MGIDAKRLGLVDTLGGLDLAVAIARERAGLEPGDEVVIAEYPSPDLFDVGMFIPGIPVLDAQQEKIREQIEFLIEHNGMPMPMISSEDWVR